MTILVDSLITPPSSPTTPPSSLTDPPSSPTTPPSSLTDPSSELRSGIHLVPVGPQRWRVVARNGVAAGHLEAYGDGAARRYRARRFHAATRTFREIGEFCSPTEAVECLRLYR